MAGNAKRRSTYGTKIKNQSHSISELYALAGIKNAPLSSTMSFGVAGGSSTPPAIDTQKRLKTSGDSMVGAIAYYPKIAVIDGSGAIDVERSDILGDLTDDYTSYLIVTPVGVADDLQTISNPSNAGQLIHLEANTTGTITLKHDTGNIFIPSEEDYTIEAGGFATLIYDVVIHTDKWVLVSSSSSNVTGMANPAVADLDMDTFDIIDVDRLQFTSDSGEGRDNTKVEMYANANTPPDAIINFPDSAVFRWTQNGTFFVAVDEDGIVPRLDDDWSIGTGSYRLKDLQTKLWTATQGTIKQYLSMTNTGAGGDHYAYVVGQMTSSGNAGYSLGSSTVYLDDYDHYWLRTSTRILDLQSGQSTAPSHAGEFRLDGTDVKVYTGGGVKNLSDIGSGGGGWVGTATSNLDMDSYSITDATNISGSGYLSIGSISAVASFYCGGANTFGDNASDAINFYGKTDWKNNTGSSGASSAGTYNGNILSPDGYITIKVSGTDKTIPYYST